MSGDTDATPLDQVPSGSDVLDELLGGGLPENRTVLVTGGPGTGKSTFGMQFLQAGLARGEDCLFVSTEQTHTELEDTFAGYDFDLRAPGLEVTTLHATTGQTLEGDDTDVTLQTLDGEESLGEGYSAPFEPEYVTKHLRQFAPVDRVVLDSVSGLSVMGDDYDKFRRAVLDLIRLFGDEFEATTLFTAEESEPDGEAGRATVAVSDAIQYNTHGVLRLWRENVEGDYHRFLEITKMRGIDHDTRRFAVGFVDSGLEIVPRQRKRSGAFTEYERMPTGIPGFDEFTGGGFVRGKGALLEHDGLAETSAILASVMGQALNEGKSLTLLPTAEMNPPELDGMLSASGHTAIDLLDDDMLFVLDPAGVWQDHENVFRLNDDEVGPRGVLGTIEERHAGDGQFMALNTEAKVQLLGADGARALRYWQEGNTIDPNDVVLDMHNPGVMSSELAEFHAGAAKQVVTTWLDDSGLQYLQLRKSPSGPVGSSRVVEYLDEPPYLRIRS